MKAKLNISNVLAINRKYESINGPPLTCKQLDEDNDS